MNPTASTLYPKWADYCISAIKYNKEKTRILAVDAHRDEGTYISMPPLVLTRKELLEKLKRGKSFVEVYWWKNEELKVKNKVEVVGEKVKLGGRGL